MKKTLLFFLILITIIIYAKGSFVDANPATKKDINYEKERAMIEELFRERSKLWNDIYERSMEIDEWTKELKNIVVEPLLSFDAEAFRQACEYPTDMDKVLDLRIVNIEDVAYGRDSMQAKIKIHWEMEGLSSKYQEEINYIVELKKENKKWKLCDYNIYQ
ncbi:hypothetical protein [Crassaminicella indica]|uniref:DUF4829 domain-containing protein n=1 Tax=Crassaminicella indica TaxID=2855394 RepID=A0ABX8RBE0_9CLOT|nr:hypothetical protein [Crassaminicella indica]QXM05784.1 hypothetical protein KVH43_10495 [Crassaminicella indica]